MFLVDILAWWYGPGFAWMLGDSRSWATRWNQMFDPSVILQTMFSPWRQITTDLGRDASLDMHLKAMLDNMVSRAVGFMIRLSIFIMAVLSLILLGFALLARLVLWPILPGLPLIMTVWYLL